MAERESAELLRGFAANRDLLPRSLPQRGSIVADRAVRIPHRPHNGPLRCEGASRIKETLANGPLGSARYR